MRCNGENVRACNLHGFIYDFDVAEPIRLSVLRGQETLTLSLPVELISVNTREYYGQSLRWALEEFQASLALQDANAAGDMQADPNE